jgi:hypothetical protein
VPGLSVQQLVQVFGQASFAPITFLHLHGRFFLVTHSHDLSLIHRPGFSSWNLSVRSLQVEVGLDTGANVGCETGFDPGCGVGCGVDRADIVLAACNPVMYAPIY